MCTHTFNATHTVESSDHAESDTVPPLPYSKTLQVLWGEEGGGGLTVHPPQLDLSVICCRGQQGQGGVEGDPVHTSVMALRHCTGRKRGKGDTDSWSASQRSCCAGQYLVPHPNEVCKPHSLSHTLLTTLYVQIFHHVTLTPHPQSPHTHTPHPHLHSRLTLTHTLTLTTSPLPSHPHI